MILKPFLKTENLLTDAYGVCWEILSDVIAEIGPVSSLAFSEIPDGLWDEFETHRDAWTILQSERYLDKLCDDANAYVSCVN